MSELLNRKYNLELEVLTPLHIGAGQEKDWMQGADYVIDHKKVYILNHKKVIENLNGNIDEFSTILLIKNDFDLKKKISGDLEEISDKVFDSPVKSTNDIKTFIKSGLSNKPIVAGSSLKGAIRSILFSFLKEVGQNKETDVFGRANIGDEFMRFIKISDSNFNDTKLVNTKIFNLYNENGSMLGGWKHARKGIGATNANFNETGFNTIYEVIPPHQIGTLSISLSDTAFDNFYLDKNKPNKKEVILKHDLEDSLFKVINEHTKDYLIKQIDFFTKYFNNESSKIIESLQAIFNSIPDDNSSCVLQMSAGSGFHSITGDWQFDDFSIDGFGNPSRGQLNRKDSAKSRKIAVHEGKFELMGFVKLSILSDEVIAKREKQRLAKIEEEKRIEQERLDKIEEQKRKDEEKRIAKIKAQQKVEEERQAKEFEEQKKRDEILRVKEEKKKQAEERNKHKHAIETEKIKKQGLSILISKIDDYDEADSIIKDYKNRVNELTESEIISIKELVFRIYSSLTNKRKKKKWSVFKKNPWKNIYTNWVPKQTAKEWYDELINK